MTGTCLRCGTAGPIEYDHPTGRDHGRPLHPDVTVPLCRDCHRAKGRTDRATGVEGGLPTLRRILARLAVWLRWLASAGRPITFGPSLLGVLAAVLETLARAVPASLPFSGAQ